MSNLTPFNKNIFDFSPSRIFDDHFNSLFKYFNTAIPKTDLRKQIASILLILIYLVSIKKILI